LPCSNHQRSPSLPDDPVTAAFIVEIEALIASEPTAEEFLARFITAVGGNPARVPQPLPPPLLKAVSVQVHGRWPWEARIPLDLLARCSFPKLVVSGGHSALFDRVCDVLEARLPAQRVVLAGAGHSIPTLGAPVNEALSKFWASAAR
jgi:hypothetical protein